MRKASSYLKISIVFLKAKIFEMLTRVFTFLIYLDQVAVYFYFIDMMLIFFYFNRVLILLLL